MKKELTASQMGKLGNVAMLETVLRDHLKIDKPKYSKSDYKQARMWVAEQNRKRHGVSRGGRPAKYPPCTHYKQTSDNPRHRFFGGVCKCGVKKNPDFELSTTNREN